MTSTLDLLGSEKLVMTTPAAAQSNTTHVYDTYGLFIHPHWYQFPLIPPVWHYAMGIFITFVSIFGSMGNLLVMYIFGTTKSLRTPSNMFVVNLSMSDFIFSIIMGFPLMTISSFNRKWIFGKVACELYGLVGGVFGLMSINTLAVIAFDRYNVIARPIKASRTLSYKRAFMMLMVVWTWSSTWTLPPLFGWGAYIPEGFQTSCTFDYLTMDLSTRSYILCLYILGFAVPLFIIMFCYFHIYKAVAAHEKAVDKRFPWLLCCCGVTAKEREDNASTAAQTKKPAMNRMDSVNSTAAGGQQSQMSEISNLDSDTGVDDHETGQVTGVSMRMKNVPKQEAARSGGGRGGAGGQAQPQQDNLAVIKDIITAFAGVMTAQAGAQQQAAQPQMMLPPQLLASLGQDPQQLQNAMYAMSQGQIPQNTAQTLTTASASGPSVSHQPAAAVVTTEAEVNGGFTNKAYQAD
ncbi:rhodopsin [Elysia marginata]|uniref:Rhodopsin n=1 Tax=Elysia marginata TaxID=1093978 RepID=A0AAV4IUD0_9GAST|nr:rhodopsin [Elysia marginata]